MITIGRAERDRYCEVCQKTGARDVVFWHADTGNRTQIDLCDKCINELTKKVTELKPCPFCGWGTIVNVGLLKYKYACNACGASTKAYPTHALAAEAWNRRTRGRDDLK